VLTHEQSQNEPTLTGTCTTYIFLVVLYTGSPVLCNEVLCTASEVVQNLPPLSLANESQIKALGAQSLQEVTQFLRHAALPASGADPAGTLSV
jgi:hypothetical protein